MPKVKAVTFDVFGTLFDWRRSLRQRALALLSGKGHQIDVESLLTIWRDKQLQYTMVSSLLGAAHTPFKELTARALRYTLEALNLQLTQYEIGQLLKGWWELEPFDDVPPALSSLKDMGLLLGLLSNGDEDMLASLARRLPVGLDGVFSAERAGAYKPHPAIYALPCKSWNLGPGEIMHVAGSGIDALGAKSYGFVTVWVNRLGLPVEEWEPKPDHVVRHFGKLAGIVREEGG